MEPLGLAFRMFPEEIKIGFYVAFLAAIAVFVVGTLARVSIWTQGKDEKDVLSGLGMLGLLKLSFIKMFSKDCIFASRVFARSRVRGLMLLSIVWSILLLFAGTLLVTADYVLNLRLVTIQSDIFPIYSLVFDLIGVFLFIGVIIGLVRRYIIKPERIITSIEDGGVLLLLLLIVLSGFVSEGLRLAVWGTTSLEFGAAEMAPVGMVFAYFLDAALEPDIGVRRLAMASHLLLTIFFVAYIPFSKLFHLFAAQITTYAASRREY